MKATKMTVIGLLTALMLAVFCGCNAEDGNVRQSPSVSPTATAGHSTTKPHGTDNLTGTAGIASSPSPDNNGARSRSNLGNDIGRGVDDIGNGVRDIGDDVGRGINDIGKDIERASGAAKQVNGTMS